MPDVVVEAGTVATVVLNRPERRNALTIPMARAVAEALEAAATSARAIVLTGAGPAFCAGGDLDELRLLAARPESEIAEGLYGAFQKLVRTVRRVPVPVIAAVNGHAMGAGMDLALACDLRVASPEARLGQVWVRLGLIPGTGGAFWTAALAGPARAAELVLTGEPVDAQTALGWGLVNEVVPPDSVVSRAREWGERIASLPPEAVAANKRALDEAMAPGYDAALAHALRVQPGLFGGPTFGAAVAERARSGQRHGPNEPGAG
jgi:enoyl-CoA hydratase/carnithine racemase